MDERQSNWSKCYWGLIVNQVLVVGLVSLLGAAMLGEAHRACEAASLELPGFTEWYYSIGPLGLLLAGAVSIAVSLAAVGLRRRIGGIVVVTVSFVSSIVFLAGGVFSSIAPLLVAIRNMLPPAEQW